MWSQTFGGDDSDSGNSIQHNGDASGIEIAKFSKIIKSEVFLKFNINLEEEVLII